MSGKMPLYLVEFQEQDRSGSNIAQAKQSAEYGDLLTLFLQNVCENYHTIQALKHRYGTQDHGDGLLKIRINRAHRLWCFVRTTASGHQLLLPYTFVDNHRLKRFPIIDPNSDARTTALADVNAKLDAIHLNEEQFFQALLPPPARATADTTVTYGGDFCMLTPQQYDVLQKKNGTVLIAPAGAGKTMIVVKWLKEKLSAKGDKTFRYVAPTERLCAQVISGLRDNAVDMTRIEVVSFAKFESRLSLALNEVQPQSQPVDQDYFEQWFGGICAALNHSGTPKKNAASKNKKVAQDLGAVPALNVRNLDSYALFTEFTQVIIHGDGTLAEGYLSKEMYIGLGVDESYFEKEIRGQIYDLFLEFLKTIPGNYHEPNLLAHTRSQKIKQSMTPELAAMLVDGFVGDEIQLRSPAEIRLLLLLTKSPQEGNWFLCGDVHQGANQLKRRFMQPLRKILNEFRIDPDAVSCVLDTNYRSSFLVSRFAHSLLQIEHLLWGSQDKMTAYGLKNGVQNDRGALSVKPCTKELCLGIKTDPTSVVLIPKNIDITVARAKFGPNVFYVSGTEGSEWENVYMYGFTAMYAEEYSELSTLLLSRALPNPEDDIHYARKKGEKTPPMRLRNALLVLYTGDTRAKNSVVFVEDVIAPNGFLQLCVDNVVRSTGAQETSAIRVEPPEEIQLPTKESWLEVVEEYCLKNTEESISAAALIVCGDQLWPAESERTHLKNVLTTLCQITPQKEAVEILTTLTRLLNTRIDAQRRIDWIKFLGKTFHVDKLKLAGVEAALKAQINELFEQIQQALIADEAVSITQACAPLKSFIAAMTTKKTNIPAAIASAPKVTSAPSSVQVRGAEDTTNFDGLVRDLCGVISGDKKLLVLSLKITHALEKKENISAFIASFSKIMDYEQHKNTNGFYLLVFLLNKTMEDSLSSKKVIQNNKGAISNIINIFLKIRNQADSVICSRVVVNLTNPVIDSSSLLRASQGTDALCDLLDMGCRIITAYSEKSDCDFLKDSFNELLILFFQFIEGIEGPVAFIENSISKSGHIGWLKMLKELLYTARNSDEYFSSKIINIIFLLISKSTDPFAFCEKLSANSFYDPRISVKDNASFFDFLVQCEFKEIPKEDLIDSKLVTHVLIALNNDERVLSWWYAHENRPQLVIYQKLLFNCIGQNFDESMRQIDLCSATNGSAQLFMLTNLFLSNMLYKKTRVLSDITIKLMHSLDSSIVERLFFNAEHNFFLHGLSNILACVKEERFEEFNIYINFIFELYKKISVKSLFIESLCQKAKGLPYEDSAGLMLLSEALLIAIQKNLAQESLERLILLFQEIMKEANDPAVSDAFIKSFCLGDCFIIWSDVVKSDLSKTLLVFPLFLTFLNMCKVARASSPDFFPKQTQWHSSFIRAEFSQLYCKVFFSKVAMQKDNVPFSNALKACFFTNSTSYGFLHEHLEETFITCGITPVASWVTQGLISLVDLLSDSDPVKIKFDALTTQSTTLDQK